MSERDYESAEVAFYYGLDRVSEWAPYAERLPEPSAPYTGIRIRFANGRSTWVPVKSL